LALGITTPLAGFLSDRFGIKRIYLAGLSCFVLGSVLCGLAPSLPILVLCRALQGVGGGIALPLGSALVLNAFPTEEQGMALGFPRGDRLFRARRARVGGLCAGRTLRGQGAASGSAPLPAAGLSHRHARRLGERDRALRRRVPAAALLAGPARANGSRDGVHA